MFEQFPYADMHQLNLDWIIKIAKAFLDQYTSIQQIITDGTANITNLAEEELQALDTRAEELQASLNAWYEDHSQDIQNQLAQAISDFASAAAQIISNVVDSIPADYSTLAWEVSNNIKYLTFLTKLYVNNESSLELNPLFFDGGISGADGSVTVDNTQKHTEFIFIGQNAVKFTPKSGYLLHARYYSAADYTTFISGENSVTGLKTTTPGNYMILVCTKTNFTDLTKEEAGGTINIYGKTIKTGFIYSVEEATTDYTGNVNVDTVNKLISFGQNGQYCRIFCESQIINVTGKTLDYSGFNSNYAYLYYNTETELFSYAPATTILPASSKYIHIGTLWGGSNTCVSLNVLPCYYVNGIRTTPYDSRYTLADVHTRENTNVFRIGILGDSTSSFNGISENTLNGQNVRSPYYPTDDVLAAEDMWYNQMRAALRTASGYIVSAVSRSSFRDTGDSTAPPVWNNYRIARIADFTNTRYIFVYAGVNDQFNNLANIGTPSYKYDTTALEAESNTSARGIELTIRKIQTQIPDANIILIVPPFTFAYDVSDEQPYTTFRNRMFEIGKTYGVKKIIDLAECITPQNKTLYTIDGIHPNKAGMKRIGHFIAEKMLTDNYSVDW
jgi:lysophospholipase L1-like esterase